MQLYNKDNASQTIANVFKMERIACNLLNKSPTKNALIKTIISRAVLIAPPLARQQ